MAFCILQAVKVENIKHVVLPKENTRISSVFLSIKNKL